MKAKIVLVGLILFLIAGMLIKINFLRIERDKLELDNRRLDNNWFNSIQEAQENKVFYLKEKEISASLRQERDDLALKLKVKPKEIERIIKVETVIKDTIIKEIQVKPIINGWSFTDSSDCYVYKGRVSYTHDTLQVYKTGFFYTNTTTSAYYRKRPHRFLFVRFGKYENFVQTESKCGQAKTEQFEFMK